MAATGKIEKLINIIKPMDGAVIAFSGGADSTLVLKAASMAGLQRILAVTAVSESLPGDELLFAKQVAVSLSVPHRIIETKELQDENFASNPPERCYYCKKELFCKLQKIALEEGFPNILDGTNADDRQDHRPGRRAASETGVRSPLLEAGLTKKEIRDISFELGLATWDKPAAPCLASRFPYGHKITAENLQMVAQAEEFLRKFGLKEFRVRHHGDIVRIEVMPEDMAVFENNETRMQTVDFFKAIGFKYVALDLQGFRSGSLNE